MSTKPDQPGRPGIPLLLVAAAFLVPLLLAAWLAGGRGPGLAGTTVNAGVLISPPVAMTDGLAGTDWQGVPGYWRALVLSAGPCGAPCRDALGTLQRLHTGLGRKAARLELLHLVAEPGPDPYAVEGVELLRAGRQGVGALRRRLGERLGPELLQPGSIFLLDWRGDLMMAYPPGSGPAPIAKDLNRLYKTLRVD